MTGRRRFIPFPCLALAVLACLAMPARAADTAAARARLGRDSTAISAMLDRGAVDSAFAAAHVTVAALRGGGDPAFEARLTLFEPGLSIRLARAKEALPAVLAGGQQAAAARDTAVWMLSMRMESMCRNYLGQFDQTERLCARWDSLAHATRNLEYQGWAATMRGWLASRRGDFTTARRELEHAVPLFETVHHPVGLPYTLNVLSGVLMAQGDYEAARGACQRQVQLGRQYGNVRILALALDNLARVESRIGDPSRAVALWREGLALYERRRETEGWLVDADNIVEESIALGRHDEARRLAAEAVTRAEAESLGMEIPWQRVYLGMALRASARDEAAKRLWRGVLAERTKDDTEPAAIAAHELIAALVAEDSTAAALALAAGVGAELAPGAEQGTRGRLVVQRAQLLTDAGRAREALALARPAAGELESAGDLEVAMAAWTEVVRAERRLGRADSTARAIERATMVWERGRSHANDLEFRELRGEQAHVLLAEAVAFALAHPPAGERGEAAAFAMAQRFKTRTLLERVAGPAAITAHAPAWLEPRLVDLARFQREVLAPDERFLEFVCGPDTTRVFVVSRDSCRVLTLPGERAMDPVIELSRESGVTTRPTGRDEPSRLGAGRLRAMLADALRWPAGTHLIVAADGALQRVPFAVLLAPGGGDARPLAAAPLTMVPSASLLAELRSRHRDLGRRLFAIAGSPGPGRAPLPGARREVQALAADYREVDEWFGSARADAPLTPARLGTYRAVHFAGHAHVDDQLPWRSGLLIGADSRGEDSLLTAERIASTPLVASLVVLSSCESGGGRVREGEGVSGLASAFLAAGGSAVVASLWPVEDRATERLMARFYDRLAHGVTADRALADAQRALASEPATAAPFYWAGFVLVGDGRTTLPLARRTWPLSPLATAAIGSAVLAVAAAGRGWSRRRRG